MINHRFRFVVIAVIYIVLFGCLIARSAYLQCVNGESYKKTLENRISQAEALAPRGAILDRYGRVLVKDELTSLNTYERVYYNKAVASHIIGTVGKINKSEYSELKTKGYSINDTLGKQGVERLAESSLRGKNLNLEEVKPGNNVVLTVDIEMQAVLEASLGKTIRMISENGGFKTGADADSGAAIVVDVQSGDVLACASYPTFDLSGYNKNYAAFAADPALPLWNRAVSGTYSPGSVFKPLVAIAALVSGAVSADEKIEDAGIYTEYEDYRPRCWIWSEQRKTHGFLNVTEAIENSCNCYFYEAGKRCGIDVISDFAKMFGLGESTGCGLSEEAEGTIANPDSKKKIFRETDKQGWFGADTLQASIGQSVNAFTPLQLANYIATLANGGTRYKLNFVKRIISQVDGRTVKEFEPEIVENIDINKNHINAVLLGMKNVAEEGSAKGIFAGYPIPIGGKTGTVQVGTNVSNHAVFTAFAPFDEPEIAICVVIEHGVRGVNAAYVARDLFDYYFESQRSG